MHKIVLAAVLATAIQPAFAYDKQGLMDAFFSVVMIRGYNDTGGLAYGSGVVVAKDKVITNCHVMRKTKKPWVSRGEDSYAITAVKVDAWHDLCLINTEGLPMKAAIIGKSTDAIARFCNPKLFGIKPHGAMSRHGKLVPKTRL